MINMKNLFIINEEEKNRILNLHETATKRQYLSEQSLNLGQQEKPEQPVVGPQTLENSGAIIKQGSGNDPYVYAKLGDNFYYAKSSDGDNPIWVLATIDGAIKSIKSKIYNENLPPIKTIKAPEKGKTKIQTPKKSDGSNKKLVNKNKTNTGGEKMLPKLKQQGFKIDKSSGFNPAKGYYVSSCKQHGCAEYTNDMLNTSLGDAWQAYSKVNAETPVSSSLVQKMTNLFNKMNKSGEIPQLENKGPFDAEAKTIITELIPDQSQFQNLPIGTVVGLYYPGSVNYDLAFFQSAIGKSRDENGNLHNVIAKPYFCKNPNSCSSTTWGQNDLNKNVKFYPGKTLSSGKSFAPVTHLGFIGYIDKNGIPYIVHEISSHSSGQVFAFPVNKLGNGRLSIVWSGKPV